MKDKITILEELRIERRNYNQNWINPCVTVGDFTYADHPRIWTWNYETKLYIGKFCSIGANVQFMLGGEHHTDWCSTYPFNVLTPNICENSERWAKTKGNIHIGNDVWIGNDAKIMSGVTIHDGAIIAGNAVVTKDVLPYRVVGGVPAKLLKWRFDDIGKAHQILDLKWWNWPKEKLSEALPLLCSSNINELITFNNEWNIKNFDCINYIITHKPYNIIEDNLYKILCVGDYRQNGTFCETDGYSISEYNNRICELTGLYWIWKNTNTEYIGLSHYRRYFYEGNNRINKEQIKNILQNYDIILTKPVHLDWTVRENIIKTVGQEYDNLAYNEIINLISNNEPNYIEAFNKVLNDNTFYNRNMFITNRKIMNEYCQWLFSFILQAADNVNISNANFFQKKVIGYYGEIMWSVWLQNKNFKIYESEIKTNN